MIVHIVGAIGVPCENFHTGHIVAKHIIQLNLTDHADAEQPARAFAAFALRLIRLDGRNFRHGEQDAVFIILRRFRQQQLIVLQRNQQLPVSIYVDARRLAVRPKRNIVDIETLSGNSEAIATLFSCRGAGRQRQYHHHGQRNAQYGFLFVFHNFHDPFTRRICSKARIQDGHFALSFFSRKQRTCITAARFFTISLQHGLIAAQLDITVCQHIHHPYQRIHPVDG